MLKGVSMSFLNVKDISNSVLGPSGGATVIKCWGINPRVCWGVGYREDTPTCGL